MIRVQVRSNEPLDAALRRFKRQCNYAGVFRLAKKYAYYEKPSDKKRREDRERIRNIQRLARKALRTRARTSSRKSKVKASQVDGDDEDIGGSEAVAAQESAANATAE